MLPFNMVLMKMHKHQHNSVCRQFPNLRVKVVLPPRFDREKQHVGKLAYNETILKGSIEYSS